MKNICINGEGICLEAGNHILITKFLLVLFHAFLVFEGNFSNYLYIL